MNLNEELDKKLNPSGTESGLYNPVSGCGVHCRDDGCLELYADGVSILLNGPDGTITINGRTLNLVAASVNNQTQPAGLTVNGAYINPDLLPTTAEILAKHSALAKTLESLRSPVAPRSEASLDAPLITGVPGEGQKITSLRLLTKPLPIFKDTLPLTGMLAKLKSILEI